MTKVGKLKVKGLSFLLSFALFFMLFGLLFCLLFGCVVLGMEWMRWWCIDCCDFYKMDEVIDG